MPRDLRTYARLLCDDSIEAMQTDGETITYWHTTVTCAGMPDNIKARVTYDNFTTGTTFDGKLMPRRYKGGVILNETTFTLK